jgi:hypothetical protein
MLTDLNTSSRDAFTCPACVAIGAMELGETATAAGVLDILYAVRRLLLDAEPIMMAVVQSFV